MRSLTRLLDAVAWLLEHALAAGFAALFAVTILNIVLRNVAGIAWLWIPGFSRLVFVWLVFLGIAAATRRGEHLVVDFFHQRMPPKLRRFTTVAIQVLMLPFYGMLFGYGRELARVRMRIPFDTWQVPTGYAYLAVPVAAALLIAFTLERLLTLALERRQP